jgi:hypothetical protein
MKPYDGPKLKQLHWETLQSSEGTVFERRKSSIMPFGKMFDDIAEDFVVTVK